MTEATTPNPGARLLDHATEDVRSVSALCKTRILEREGIPMFVALDDARPGRDLQVRDALHVDEGRRLAALFEHYERGLAEISADADLHEAAVEGDGPDSADPKDDPKDDPMDDPTGAAALIDVLVVLSDQHLRARPELPS